MSRFTSLVDDIHTRLDDATVDKIIGEKNKRKHGQLRRLKWYRQGGTIENVAQAGGRKAEGDTERTPAVWQRLERFTVLIHAESDDTLDTLLDNVIVAIDKTASNAVEWGEYEWADDEYAKRGNMTALSFSIKMPVSDEQKALVVITDTELTYIIDEDL